MLDIALLVLIGCVNNLSITQKSKTGNHTKNRKTNRLIVIPNRIHYKPGRIFGQHQRLTFSL